MQHVLDGMLDIETLDTRPTAVVLSIGAVAFDPETELVDSANGFHLHLNIDEQLAVGRTIAQSTLLWWMDQDEAARAKQYGADRVPVREALESFTAWVDRTSGDRRKEFRMWGNGAAFDNAILASLYADMNMPLPWMFWNDRCYRTLKALHGTKAPEFGTAHDALDDAIKQSVHLQQIYKTSRWSDPNKVSK